MAARPLARTLGGGTGLQSGRRLLGVGFEHRGRRGVAAGLLTPLLVSLWVLRRTGAELAVFVALLAAHPVVAALAVLLGIPAPGVGLAAGLTGTYLAFFLYVAWRLESRRPDWATWVHPFAVVAAFSFVVLVAQALGAGAGLVIGALLLVAGALLTVTLSRGVHLAATVVGGALWDFWLYEELSLGPVAGLALTLTLGLSAIALGVAAWRRRGSGRVGAPASARRSLSPYATHAYPVATCRPRPLDSV
jgi:hypothetical protein